MCAGGGDPAVGFGGLHVLLAPVVRAHRFAAGLPGPEAAVRTGDDGLAVVAGDPVGFHAFRQAGGCYFGRAVGQVPGVPVRVLEEEPLAESVGLDDAHALVLFNAFELGFSCAVRVPGPGLPVRVQDEDPLVGGHGGHGLRLPGQAGRGLFGEFRGRVLAAGLAVLVGVDPALLVHG